MLRHIHSPYGSSILATARLALLASGASAQVRSARSSGSAQSGPVDEVLSAPVPNAAELADRRTRELLTRMPDCSVLRLNADGLPDVLMDMYFGTDGPESNAALRQLAESFQFGSEDSDGADAKSLGYRDSESGERADLPDWRTLISPGVTMPEGEPNMTFFDPSKDIVIAFRPARMNLSCSLSWRVGFDGYHHSGVTTWFGGVMLADGITAVAQARRDRNTNPNLYLYRWNGSSWPLVRRSEKGSYMDMVNWNSASCTRSAFQLGVHMANEGYYSAYIFTFDAG